jgi:hypothetical protein
MNRRSIALAAIGAGLLALAAWLATFPRPNPRPALPEIASFAPGERIALILAEPRDFPAVDSMGLVQRARTAGAEVRVFHPDDSFAAFAPTRIYQPSPWAEMPTGYHPDQWPYFPSGTVTVGNPQILVLAPAEAMTKNAAVLAAARAIGIDVSASTRETRILARARRAEIYLSLHQR